VSMTKITHLGLSEAVRPHVQSSTGSFERRLTNMSVCFDTRDIVIWKRLRGSSKA
jgi:hypothetical protein